MFHKFATFFYKQPYEWLFSSGYFGRQGNFKFRFRNQGNVKITMILTHFCNKQRCSAIHERQIILMKMFAIVMILQTIKTEDPAIAVPSNNLEEGCPIDHNDGQFFRAMEW